MTALKEFFNFISFIAVTYFGFSLVSVLTSIKSLEHTFENPTEMVNFIVSIIGLISTIVYIIYIIILRKETLKNVRLKNESDYLDNELKKRKIDDFDKKQ